MTTANRFLLRNPEKSDLNQYWFSQQTIETLVQEIEQVSAGQPNFRVACISTPSLYFTLPPALKSLSRVFDVCVTQFDRKFASDPGYVFYDFNSPEAVAEDLKAEFDLAVVDPPFITREVWSKYATTTKLLLKPGGKVVLSSIRENTEMLWELLQVRAVAFMPSIPHLVYQYTFFTNYDSPTLTRNNAEIPLD